MQQIVSMLSDISPIQPRVIKHLSGIIHVRMIPRKTRLLIPGKVSQHVYFIGSGLLRAYYTREGKEICTWFMREGDVVLSVRSFYKQIPSEETIEALEDTELYYISNDDLQKMYLRFPKFNIPGRVLTEKYYVEALERQITLQLTRARDRYSNFLKQHGDLLQRLSSKHIASYIATSQENLSRIRRKMTGR